MTTEWKSQDKDLVFALDIGTHSIIGVVGQVENEKFKVLAMETETHGKRAMLDGQIEDIDQVSKTARCVTKRLEETMGVRLSRVCVAAAGRALRTQRGHFNLTLPSVQRIDNDLIGQLEAGAVSEAEAALSQDEEGHHPFFLVGYTVSQYLLDRYPMTTLKGHSGQTLESEVVATFLPSEVVESLYAVMHGAGLEIVSLTLEPIAAINAAIPQELRLLNLVLADIGAGTSDIAICREGTVVGYTMVTTAGDEITEVLMKAFLTDFETAERMKLAMGGEDPIPFTDILGLDQTVTPQELLETTKESVHLLAREIASRILEINGGTPSALFLSGGGSKLQGLCGLMADCLGIDARRVAVAGSNFSKSSFSEVFDLNHPEYATPLGIAISAGLGLIHDSYLVTLNGQSAKLFRSGTLTVRDILLMNGYTYSDMLGHTSQNLLVIIDGKRTVFHGEPAVPAVLRLNGKDAATSAVVHAGDSIEFIPARHGRSIEKKLGELLPPGFVGEVLINGKDAVRDTLLHPGDVVTTLPAQSPKPVLPSQDTSTASDLEDETAFPIPTQASSERLADYTPSSVPQVKERHSFRFLLNEEPLVLPPKENGLPYYMMDLLNHSKLDFSHLEYPVSLKINGTDAFFLQELHNDDCISICCELPEESQPMDNPDKEG